MKPALVNKDFYLRLSLASLLVFCTTAILVFILHYTTADDVVFEKLHPFYTGAATRFMLVITVLGKHSFLVPANLVLTLLFFLGRKKGWALRTLVISIGGVSLMGLLKNLFARHRPPAPLVDGITNYGFPSGHAMMSVAFYGLLIFFCWEFMKVKWQRQLLVCFLFLLILLIGFSRIYLRVHYTTDVIAGYSIGLCWLSICLIVAGKIESRKA